MGNFLCCSLSSTPRVVPFNDQTFDENVMKWQNNDINNNEKRLLLLGLRHAGKTALINYIIHSHKNNMILPSVPNDCHQYLLYNHPSLPYSIKILDTCGRITFHQQNIKFISNTQYIFYIINISDQHTINFAIDYLHTIINQLILPSDPKVLIILNQWDQQQHQDMEQLLRINELDEIQQKKIQIINFPSFKLQQEKEDEKEHNNNNNIEFINNIHQFLKTPQNSGNPNSNGGVNSIPS